MFSGNDRISERQMFRNYTVGFISLSALLAPAIMNRTNGSSIGLALLLLGLYLAVTACVPAPGAYAARAVCYVHYWVLGTMIARMTGMLIREFLLTGTSLALILVWFYLFCFYNLYKGLECRIRVSEILFPFFVLMFVLLSLLMLGETEVSRCLELEFSLNKDQLRTGYELFIWFSAIQSLWHLHGKVQGEASYKKTVGLVWAAGAAVTVLWSLFTYSIYGEAGHTGLVFPLASAMTLAHFPGNVIGRLDALFVFAWTIGLFLLCSTLFAPIQAGEPDRRRKYVLAALLAASCACALQSGCLQWCRWFLCYVSMPMQILLLLWRALDKKGRRRLLSSALLLSVFLLTGCGNQELEERSLVTAVGVDEGTEKDYRFTFCFGSFGGEEEEQNEEEEHFETEASSLEEAEQIYYESSRKNMDFNHLKNFYFFREVLREDEFAGLLEEIQMDGTYSRGTSVYVSYGPASEAARKEEQPEEGVPMHRILNAWYNQESCEIPILTEEQMYKGSISWPY